MQWGLKDAVSYRDVKLVSMIKKIPLTLHRLSEMIVKAREISAAVSAIYYKVEKRLGRKVRHPL